MATAITLGHGGTPASIDLNNQATPTGYFVDAEGFIPGPPARITWDEAPNYASGMGQVNIQTKNLIAVPIPMMVRSNSVANLNTALGSLWTLVQACTWASPGTLQIGSETAMTIVTSDLPQDLQRNSEYELLYYAEFTLVLTRRAY